MGLLAEPLSPGRDEDEARELLRAVFRPGLTDRYEDEYPLALASGASALAHRRVVRAAGRIVSHAAGMLATQRAGPLDFRIGFIGSVATDPAFRGRGGAGEALRATEESLASAGAVLVALWSGDRAFYERRGYVAAGRELRLTLPPAAEGPERALVTPLLASDLPALRALHLREVALTLRSGEDEARLFAVPGTHGFALRDGRGEGSLAAYAVVGRGADFPFHVHEWGGDDAAVATLVMGVAALHRGRSITALVPAFREGLAARLEARGAAREEHPLGLFKIVRPAALVDLVNGLFSARRAPHRARWDGEAVEIHVGGGAPRRLLASDWLRAVIGPDERGLPDLPLPFFVWGMDSI